MLKNYLLKIYQELTKKRSLDNSFFDPSHLNKPVDNKSARLTLIIAALGILTFLVIATFFPLWNRIFSQLYPKPSSFAVANMPTVVNENIVGVQGYVKSLLVTDDGIFVGGNFNYIGPNTGTGVPLSTSTGERLPNYAKFNRRVTSSISDGNGGWFVGGMFSKIGGVDRNWLAHILADGSLDQSFNANITNAITSLGGSDFDNGVKVMALSPDKSTLYLGGSFTSIGGGTNNRKHLAAIKVSTGELLPWAPITDQDGAYPYALAISPDGKTVYIGGDFNMINGQTRKTVAAVDATTGNLLPWTTTIDGTVVWTLAISSDGKYVYAGGSFSTTPNTGSSLAKIDASTGVITAMPAAIFPNKVGYVYSLALSSDDSTLYIGGDFIKAIDTTTGEAKPSLNVGYASDEVRAIALSSDNKTLYLGGYFTDINGTSRTMLAAVDIGANALTSWNPTAADGIYALALNADNSAIFAGGDAGSIGNGQVVYRQNLAKLNKNGTVDTVFNPDSYPDSAPLEMILSKDKTKLYLGGAFTQMGTQSRAMLAAVEASTGALLAFNANVSGVNGYATLRSAQVFKMAQSPDGNTLYIGGNFSKVGVDTRNNIAAIELSSGLATTFNPNSTAHVLGLQLTNDGSILYAIGNFDSGQVDQYGAKIYQTIAAFNTTTGAILPWRPIQDTPYLMKLSPDNLTLYVAGATELAAYDLVTGDKKTDFKPTVGNVNISTCTEGDLELSPDGSILYFAGQYAVGTEAVKRQIRAFDAITGEVLTWSVDITDGTVVSPIVIVPTGTGSDYSVIIGGCFVTINDNPIQHLVGFDQPSSQLNSALTPTPTDTPIPTPTPGSSGGGDSGGGGGGGDSGGGGGGGTGGTSSFVPVVPQSPPKTGRQIFK